MARYPKSRILKNRMRKSDLTRDLDPSFNLLEGQIDPVANIAELSNLSVTDMVTGSIKYVSTLKSWFKLDKTSLSTLVAFVCIAANGGGRWLRTNVVDNDTLIQANWYIDPTSGNDENNGLTSGTAIKTWAEFIRRVGLFAYFTTRVDVFLLGDLPSSDPLVFKGKCSPSATIYVHGTLTAVDSGGTFTSITARSAATNIPQSITDTARTAFTTNVSQLLKVTAGTAGNIGSWCWVAKDLGGNAARTTQLAKQDLTAISILTEVTPVVGDTYVLYTLSKVANFDIEYNHPNPAITGLGGKFILENLRLGTSTGTSRILSSSRFMIITGCIWDNTGFPIISGSFSIINCWRNGANNFFISGAAPLNNAIISAGGALCLTGFNNGATCTIQNGYLSNSGGAAFNVAGSNSEVTITDAMAMDWGANGALTITSGGTARMGSVGLPGKLSGTSATGSSFGIDCSGGRCYTPDASTLTITGAASFNFQVAGRNTLPPFNYTATPPVYATPINCTWSNLTSPNDATHFGGSAIDPLTGFGISKIS